MVKVKVSRLQNTHDLHTDGRIAMERNGSGVNELTDKPLEDYRTDHLLSVDDARAP